MSIYRGLVIRLLQATLVVALGGAVWLIFRSLPATPSADESPQGATTLNIFMERPGDANGLPLDIAVNIYPVDVVAVRHEFFTEPRTGKRFDDFLKERMKGRSPISTHLDKQGRGVVVLSPGSWWLHAKLAGDEELEWRVPLCVIGGKQTFQLNPQNAYTRSKTF